MMHLLTFKKDILVISMFDLFFNYIFLYSFSSFLFFSSVIYEYILLFKPTNSRIGLPAASSLNLPITFLFSLEKYLEDSG